MLKGRNAEVHHTLPQLVFQQVHIHFHSPTACDKCPTGAKQRAKGLKVGLLTAPFSGLRQHTSSDTPGSTGSGASPSPLSLLHLPPLAQEAQTCAQVYSTSLIVSWNKAQPTFHLATRNVKDQKMFNSQKLQGGSPWFVVFVTLLWYEYSQLREGSSQQPTNIMSLKWGLGDTCTI